jgi:hypothetical protein
MHARLNAGRGDFPAGDLIPLSLRCSRYAADNIGLERDSPWCPARNINILPFCLDGMVLMLCLNGSKREPLLRRICRRLVSRGGQSKY